MQRAESLPTKSINQYRSRDIFAYLALRYCSQNAVVRDNEWTENNAVQIVLGSNSGSYLRSYHFKQIDAEGNIEHRQLFVPSAAESLAEAALLARCEAHWDRTCSPKVFSYRPTDRNNKQGYFDPYMKGLRRRQARIAEMCHNYPNGIVAYIDIKRFYPSITTERAATKWVEFCISANMPDQYTDLGLKLLKNYKEKSGDGSILTGPMFSHFVANLVLSPIDQFSAELPCSYVRYVDDMTLVGDRQEVEDAIKLLDARLRAIDLHIHALASPKTLIIPTKEWLNSANDFLQGPHSIAWMRLIGDIKKLLLFDQAKAGIEDALLVEGYRLPIPDYALAIEEASAFQKVRQLGLWQWLRLKTKRVSVDTIVRDAQILSARLASETTELLETHQPANPFQRKRMASKLRYRLGRLIYLGLERDLESIVAHARTWPELRFHVAIINALLTSDCSEVIAMGSNVAQATAQVFRPTMKTAKFSEPISTEVEIQGLAVLILNGVPVEGRVRTPNHPMLRFARGPVDEDLMKQPRGLLQELACLHGIGEVRHSATLGSAFDIDENLSLDALELDYGYYS